MAERAGDGRNGQNGGSSAQQHNSDASKREMGPATGADSGNAKSPTGQPTGPEADLKSKTGGDGASAAEAKSNE